MVEMDGKKVPAPSGDGRSAQRTRHAQVDMTRQRLRFRSVNSSRTRSRHAGGHDWFSARSSSHAQFRNDRGLRSKISRSIIFPRRICASILPTQRGEAGAPLLNFKGEVVGILVSSLENNSSCYALPIDAAEKIRSDFVRFGEPRHGWIGINVSEAPKAVEGSRAEMTKIMDGHAGGRFRRERRRYSIAGRQNKSARAGGCARCVLLHHCGRHRSDHGHARKRKADLRCRRPIFIRPRKRLQSRRAT